MADQPTLSHDALAFLANPRAAINNKTLVIAANPDHAAMLRLQFADRDFCRAMGNHTLQNASPLYRVTYPFESLLGTRFARILMADRVFWQISASPRENAWFEEVVLCRLLPKGEVIRLG